MPAFASVLNDKKIVAALSWLKALWPPGVRERHDEVDAAGREEKARGFRRGVGWDAGRCLVRQPPSIRT